MTTGVELFFKTDEFLEFKKKDKIINHMKLFQEIRWSFVDMNDYGKMKN